MIEELKIEGTMEFSTLSKEIKTKVMNDSRNLKFSFCWFWTKISVFLSKIDINFEIWMILETLFLWHELRHRKSSFLLFSWIIAWDNPSKRKMCLKISRFWNLVFTNFYIMHTTILFCLGLSCCVLEFCAKLLEK